MLGKRLRSPSPAKDAAKVDEETKFKEDSSLYELKHGLRFVKPYNHEFTTFVKRRWIG